MRNRYRTGRHPLTGVAIVLGLVVMSSCGSSGSTTTVAGSAPDAPTFSVGVDGAIDSLALSPNGRRVSYSVVLDRTSGAYRHDAVVADAGGSSTVLYSADRASYMTWDRDDSLLVARPVGTTTCFDRVEVLPSVRRNDGPCVPVQMAGPFVIDRRGGVIATTERGAQRTAIDSIDLTTGRVTPVFESPTTYFYSPVVDTGGVTTAVAVDSRGMGPVRRTARLVQAGPNPSEPVVRPSANLLPVFLAAVPGSDHLVMVGQDSEGRRRVYALRGEAATVVVDDAANSGVSISSVGTMAWSTKRGSSEAIVVERVDLP